MTQFFRMEKHLIPHDLPVFGIQVTHFPEGIGECFDQLIKMISGKFDRDYYGISYMDINGKMVYFATALEKEEGEAKKFNCQRLIIEKGTYLSITVHDWRKKTDQIKGIFDSLLQNKEADKTKPAIEWYKNDQDMQCMLKTNP